MAELPDTLTPEQMASFSEEEAPDVLTPEQMAAAEEDDTPDVLTPEEMQAAIESPDVETKVSGDYISDSEVAAIAKRHGVSEGFVRNWALYSGTATEMHPDKSVGDIIAEAAQQTAGSLGNMIGGLPQLAAKKALYDEGSGERAAIDEIRELASERASGSRVIGEIAGGLAVPAGPVGKLAEGISAIKGATRAGTLAKKAAANAGLSGSLGTLYGVAQSKEGEELEAAGEGALWGIILSPALFQAGAGAREAVRRKDKAAEAIEDLLDHDTTRDLWHTTEKKWMEKGDDPLLARLSTIEAAPQEYRDDAIQFARHISPSKEVKNLDDAKRVLRAQTDQEFLREQLRNYRIATEVQEKLHKRIDDMRGKTAKDFDGEQSLSRMLKDSRYVLSEIDQKHGLTVERIADKLSNAHNLSTHVRGRMYKDLDKLGKMTRKSGRDSADIIDEIEKAKPGITLSKEAEAWKQVFSKWRLALNQINKTQGGGEELIPLLAGGKKNYVPVYAVDGAEFIIRVEKKMEDLEKSLGDMFGDEGIQKFSDLSDEQLGEWINKARKYGHNSDENQFLRSLDMMFPEGHKISTPDGFATALNIALSPAEAGRAIRLNAPSLQKRKGALPDYLREKDLAKLFDKWGNTMSKEAYLRRGIDQLRAAEKALKESGMVNDAKYVGDLATDIISGPSRGLAKTTRDWLNRVEVNNRKKALQYPEGSLRRRFYDAKANAGQLLTVGSANMYPYFLGARADAAIRNMTQPFLLTATEMQTPAAKAYGQKLAMLAQFDVWTSLKGRKDIVKELQRTGKIPDKFRGEVTEAIREGMLKDPGMKKMASKLGKRGLEKIGDAAMLLYTFSDTHNRTVTYAMSKRLAADIIQGLNKKGKGLNRDNEAALSILREMPRSYRVKLRDIYREGDYDKFADEIADYYLAKTQFNYNRTAMSDYGRRMGSLFSMFSKWPTAMLGDVADIVQKFRSGDQYQVDRATQKALYRYLGPLAAAFAFEKAVLEDVREDSPRMKHLIGSNTMTWTPISSLSGFLSGDFATPPVLSVPNNILGAAMKGNLDKLPGKSIDGIMSVTPGGVLWRIYDNYVLRFDEEDEYPDPRDIFTEE